MLKVKLGLFLLVVALFFSGCGPSKTDVLEKLVSKKENQLKMQIFSASKDWDFEVNKVHNSEPTLLKYIQQVTIHSENDKLQWLKILGLDEKSPVILIFDTEKMVFHTNDPEKLREFAKSLDK
ncbi:hypothetical protein Back11_33110 [Paenibacillus baekrokdamisoli]|uniref:Uncharacterized protein n=1 Tax=Paenibacillus baekrokdamisoli TaxID=1712516 RepID=A0A3G9IU99_9BACL|nr:hypothetical protein [Paenibacillus baekrokdamisoli]MBB3071519.1 hypothetical protein [Paenibacillus baekrokdamisoli]BBH21966.1 hypothetical protein Back11_33110 [Paenibacillus baekrokdamisoli]